MVKLFKLFWIVSFFIGCIVPLLHMDTAEISKQENRILADFPQIVQAETWNQNYGPDFENWLNDRFWGRNQLIHLHERIQFINRVVRNKDSLYLKKDGWMFNSIPKFSNHSENKISKTVKKIQQFENFCENQGIKLYILAIPRKEIIYAEKLDEIYHVSRKKINNYLNAFNHMSGKLGSTFIFPYVELKKATENDFVFFKASHHWTDYGAYIGYCKLMESIQQDFKDVKIVSLDDYKKSLNQKIRDDWGRQFNMGNTTNLLAINPRYAEQHILKTNYIYYDPKKEIKPTVVDIPGYKVKTFQNPDPRIKYKVFLSGFSQNENLLQFLPYSFSEVRYYRLNNVKGVKETDRQSFLKRYQRDLLEYKPDILIMTIENYQLFSKNLWNIED